MQKCKVVSLNLAHPVGIVKSVCSLRCGIISTKTDHDQAILIRR